MKNNQEQKKVMSAEEWYDSETEQGYVFMDMFDFAAQYANYILSQGIDELSERIAVNGKVNGYGFVDKFSILKIANDFKTELNLQNSK